MDSWLDKSLWFGLFDMCTVVDNTGKETFLARMSAKMRQFTKVMTSTTLIVVFLAFCSLEETFPSFELSLSYCLSLKVVMGAANSPYPAIVTIKL